MLFENVEGSEGKTVIDATNLYGVVPPDGFPSNAEFVKSKTNGPTAKSFNTNYASLYPQAGGARARPGNLWCGDEEARDAVEQLNRDAGYDPVYMGPIENAAIQEGAVPLVSRSGREWAHSSTAWLRRTSSDRPQCGESYACVDEP